MRLDKYLKVSRLIKRRTIANEACDAGRISVNGKVAKASYDVKEGDVVKEVNEPRYIEPKQQLYLIISYNITVNFIKKIHDGWKYLIFQIKLLCSNHNFRASFGQL